MGGPSVTASSLHIAFLGQGTEVVLNGLPRRFPEVRVLGHTGTHGTVGTITSKLTSVLLPGRRRPSRGPPGLARLSPAVCPHSGGGEDPGVSEAQASLGHAQQ